MTMTHDKWHDEIWQYTDDKDNHFIIHHVSFITMLSEK